MTEQLSQTIEGIARGIAAGSFRSEAEISQHVVLPVLQGLGWNPFAPGVVVPQFKIGNRKVDYALCQPPGKAAILLEVKDLGKADGKGERQLFEYCFHQGVPIAVLTDGRIWSFFFPAGQGSYEERRFARIDLLDDDHRKSAGTLVRYLELAAVKSQKARRRAEQDYEQARSQRQAASQFESVWRALLSGPESLILDLFLEEVERETKVRPDRERAAHFVRSQIAGGGLRTEPVPDGTAKPAPQPRPKPPSFTIQDRTETFETGAKLLGGVFREFALMDPDFCRRYAERYSGRVQKFVARSRREIHPGSPPIQRSALPLPGGWWVSTHMGNKEKLKRIKQACELLGLEYGRDVIVELHIGSRKSRKK